MEFQTNLVHQRQLPSFPPNIVPILVLQPYAAPATSELAPQRAPTQNVPHEEGLSFGTFLAIGTTIVSAAVMLDPKASKEAKAIAQTALGVSLPFVLTKAFDLQDWPGQQWN